MLFDGCQLSAVGRPLPIRDVIPMWQTSNTCETRVRKMCWFLSEMTPSFLGLSQRHSEPHRFSMCNRVTPLYTSVYCIYSYTIVYRYIKVYKSMLLSSCILGPYKKCMLMYPTEVVPQVYTHLIPRNKLKIVATSRCDLDSHSFRSKCVYLRMHGRTSCTRKIQEIQFKFSVFIHCISLLIPLPTQLGTRSTVD